MHINPRIAAITPSASLTIATHAKNLKASGRAVFDFSAGEPDFDTPHNVKEAAAKALIGGTTKYAPVPGIPSLLAALSEKLKKDNGLEYAPSQILVSNGAKHSLFNLICSITGPGDEVIIPSPYWLSYPEMVNVAGSTSVFVHTRESNGYKMTPDELRAALTPRTRAVIINSPSNPVGCVYSREELMAIVEALRSFPNCAVISDEIYEKMIYDGAEHVSIASLDPELFKRTIVVNGFSKSYSMTGWRLGYLAGPTDVVKAASALQSHSTSGATTFAQYGAVEALKPESQRFVSDMLAAFTERRRTLYERLCAIDGITCPKPMGAFYAIPNISSFGIGSVEFCERLLDEAGVAAVPGISFGADSIIRLSYACSMDTITQGLDRLEAFVARL